MRIVLSAVGAFLLKMLGAALFLVVFLFLFVIVVLCLFLFCPIRYKGEAEYDGNLTAKGKVTWLFSFLSVSFSYQKGEADSKIKVLGFDVLKFLEKRQKNDTGHEKRGSKAKRKRKNNKGKAGPLKNEPDLQISQIEEPFSEDTISEKTAMPDLEISEVLEKETDQTDLEVCQIQEEKDKQIGFKGSEGWEKEKAEQTDLKVSEKQEKKEAEKSGLNRFFHRIKEWFLLPGKKIKGFFRALRRVIKNVKSKAEWLSQLKVFWKSENTQGMVCIFKDNVLHLLRKIKPKVLRGTIFFGTGDPCMTGQILGVAAVLYAVYGKGIQVVPDFEEARLEGELYVRGRLSMITLVLIVIKIFRSNEWKQFKYDFDQLKEAL